MIHKFTKSPCFKAGDHTWLRELLHPKNDRVALNFSLAHAFLEQGECSLPHRLEASSETYFFLEGCGEISLDGEVFSVGKFDTVLVPAGTLQSVKNTGDCPLTFLCIVSPPWSADDEKIV
jgi:mannose-6-phosphate isomerase-like protein (cupin superfamily)